METGEGSAIRKGGDKNDTWASRGEKFRDFIFPLLINRPVGGHCFDDYQPIAYFIVNENVRSFATRWQDNTQPCENGIVTDNFLICCVTQKEHFRTTDKSGNELFDNASDKGVLPANRKIDRNAVW